MRKIVLLSFDDGTIWDRWFGEMLDYYEVPCTFNLNSGLEDFVWECDGMPVRRLRLAENRDIYARHEVASHTLSHPVLTQLPEEELLREVGEDCANLKAIFGMEDIGFAVPFNQCGEREIDILRRSGLVKYIRLSEFKNDFAPPEDPFHIYVNGLYNEPELGAKLAAFSRSRLPLSVFVLCGHSYEFELNREWERMESVLKALKFIPGVEFMTTMEFVKTFY